MHLTNTGKKFYTKPGRKVCQSSNLVMGQLGNLQHLDADLDEVKEEVSPTKTTKIIKLKANQIKLPGIH